MEQPTHGARQRILAFWTTLKDTALEFKKIDPLKEASSLAFTTIFAIPGVLIITLMVASAFYDADAVREALYTQAGGFIGAQTSQDLQGIVQKASATESGLFSKILGIGALALSATTAFAALQSSLNKIWRVEQEPGRAILRYLFSRLTSLALIGAFGFLLLISMVLDTALVAIAERAGKFLPGHAILVGIAGLILSLGVVTLVFALVFKFLPDVRVRWRSVWMGALFTAALFTLGKYLIALYIAKTGAGNAYGAGGAVIIIMLWVYYSSIILLFGAQYTFVAARKHGERIEPAPHAVRTSAR
ncbi:MAG: YihY/virulence factor BrkB family protein [Flavobacteriales bacterium]